MPQVLLTESISYGLGAQDPWPDDVKLFQPFEVEQILLPESAACLSVKAYLKMCRLPFSIEMRNNAEYMSPNGHVPFIKAGAFVVAELDPIIAFVGSKDVSLTGHLNSSEKADMRAYMSLVNNVLSTAELFISWLDPSTYEDVTKPRYGSVYPWPLNKLLTYQKYYSIEKRLKVLGWKYKKLDQVYKEVRNCCNALSERLDSSEYFFGNSPTELDALVFGHLFNIITIPLPSNELAKIVRQYENLTNFCKRIEASYFKGSPSHSIVSFNGRSSSNGEDFDKLEDITEIQRIE